MKTRLIISTLVTAAICASPAVAQDRKLFPADVVPRNRLITTGELFNLLELSSPQMKPITDALHAYDTTRALHLFVQHIRTRTAPRYFFDPATVPSRARTYAQQFPDDDSYAEETVDDFMKKYGTNVDWRVPGKDLEGTPHTPNTVRFLARQLYGENFGSLYYIKGKDRRYPDFQMGQWRDFIRDVEAGAVETGGNDVFERFYGGHRVRNWMMFHQLLLGSEVLTDDDQVFIIKSFLLHGARIVDNCKKFNWGNHQLVGLCALYEMTLMYPEFPVMRQWNGHVFKLVLEHLDKEVKDDGFQFERASHYFKLDIFNYFRAFRIAEVNGIVIPAWARERFRRMFHAILAVLMPNGAMPPLQDAQDTYIGSRNIDEARKSLGVSETANSAELVDPPEGPFLALGAYLYRDPQLKYFGSRTLHAGFSWFLPEDAQTVYASLASTAPTFTSTALVSSGYYVMRGGWSANNPYMIVDGGLAQFKPDHTHGGVLGLIAFANGAMILPNYRVRYSSPSYPFMKNSFVKNVALADSILQGRGWIGNAAQTGFGKWAWLPTPTVLQWTTGDSTDRFMASHNGFDTVGVAYTREILFVKPAFWVVRDRFTAGNGAHSAQQFWQGKFETVEPGHVRSVQGPARLDIIQVSRESLTAIAGGGNETESIVFHAAPAKQHEFVSVLIPSSSAKPAEFSVRKSGAEAAEISFEDRTYTISFSSHEPIQVRW